MAKNSTGKAGGKKKKGADALKARAHKVWLAGLGALSVAEAEGSKLFHQLVEKGADLEKRGKPVVDKFVQDATDKAQDVGKKAKARAGKVGDEAKAGWSKVEHAVDEKVSAALQRLGIPSRKEIEDLKQRVATLTEQLDGRSGGRKTARKAAKGSGGSAAKPPVKRPAKRSAPKAATAGASASEASGPAAASGA